MTMLGFTAEASLPSRSGRYHMVGTPNTHVKGREVVPQFCYTNAAGVTTCCDCYYGYCWCRTIHHIFYI